MPFETKLSGDLLIIKLRGDVTEGEFAQHAGELRQIEKRLDFSPNRLTDLSECTSHPDFAALSGFAQIRTRAELNNPVKSAVYAPTDFQFGVARMFQAMNRNPQIQVAVFRNEAEARAWLTTPTTDKPSANEGTNA